MKIALVSVTGHVGSRMLAELRKRGHEVTGIVLHPEKLQSHDGLVAQRGDIKDEAGRAQLLAGHGVVLSAVRCQSISGRMSPLDNDRQKAS